MGELDVKHSCGVVAVLCPVCIEVRCLGKGCGGTTCEHVKGEFDEGRKIEISASQAAGLPVVAGLPFVEPDIVGHIWGEGGGIRAFEFVCVCGRPAIVTMGENDIKVIPCGHITVEAKAIYTQGMADPESSVIANAKARAEQLWAREGALEAVILAYFRQKMWMQTVSSDELSKFFDGLRKATEVSRIQFAETFHKLRKEGKIAEDIGSGGFMLTKDGWDESKDSQRVSAILKDSIKEATQKSPVVEGVDDKARDMANYLEAHIGYSSGVRYGRN